MSKLGLKRAAELALGYTLLVILWGAYVRVSGSGAGCGNHWPTCQGEIVPRSPGVATVIEVTHRITSGLALPAVLWVLYVAMKVGSKNARVMAGASVFFMVSEAILGAALVKFEKVAYDQSIGRAYWMGAHLINTFLLVGSMTLAVLAARDIPFRWGSRGRRGLSLAALVALVLTGVTGAVAALGDTLFPAASFMEGLRMDAAPQHLFVELRVYHPYVAVVTAIGLLTFASSVPMDVKASRRLVVLVVMQVGVGILNLVLNAPAWMQLVHLLVADLVWMATWVAAASAPEPATDEPALARAP